MYNNAANKVFFPDLHRMELKNYIFIYLANKTTTLKAFYSAVVV